MADSKFTLTDVRNAFKSGATPDETDYARLIDLATVGSLAAGAEAADATTPHPGTGLVAESTGQLSVLEGKGISVAGTGVAVRVDDSTVIVDNKTNQLGIAVKSDAGLSKDGGLHVVTGAGLAATDADGLHIHLADAGGLAVDSTSKKLGVVVDPKLSGLELGQSKELKVRVDTTANYIVSGEDGVTFDDDGLKKIRTVLANGSLDTLKAAVAGTESGFKKDHGAGATSGSVESQVAEALNTAYGAGWNLEKAREVLGTEIKKFMKENEKKFKADSVISLSYNSNYMNLFARGAKNKNDTAQMFTGKSLKVARVNEAGEAEWITTDAGNLNSMHAGIYAIIGIIGSDGRPLEKGELYTEHALMVVVAVDKVMAIVGYWQLLSQGSWNRGPEFDPLVYNDGYETLITELEASKPETKPLVVWTDKDNVIDLKTESGITLKNTGDVLHFVPGSSPEVWKKVVKEEAPDPDGKVTLVGEGALKMLAVEVPATGDKPAGVAELNVAVHFYPYQIAKNSKVKIPKEGLDLFKAGILTGTYKEENVSFTVIEPTDKSLKATIVDGSKLTCKQSGTVTIKVVVKGSGEMPEQIKNCALDVSFGWRPTWRGEEVDFEVISGEKIDCIVLHLKSGEWRFKKTQGDEFSLDAPSKTLPWLKDGKELTGFQATGLTIQGIDGIINVPEITSKFNVHIDLQKDLPSFKGDYMFVYADEEHDDSLEWAIINFPVGMTATSGYPFDLPNGGQIDVKVKFV